MKKKALSRQMGFTLVEILVVIALLILLAGLLFPVLSTVHQRSKEATCLSNLHQVGLATRLYADDCDGHYPYSAYAFGRKDLLNALTNAPIYVNVVFPYLKSPEVFHCPIDVQRDFTNKNLIPNDNSFERSGTSYSYLMSPQSFANADSMFYQLQLANPSKAHLCRDAGTWHGMVLSSGYDNYRQVVYLDLHVKKMRLQQLIDEDLEIFRSGESN